MRRPLRSPGAAARGLTDLTTTHVGRIASCAVGELTRRGPHSAPVTTGPDKTVLLFFEDIERDRWLRHDRYLQRTARRVYHAVTEGQRVSGFEIAFRLLVRALERAGCRVVVNNPALARRHPEHPIGLAGYPHILERWELPNPVVLGPGLLDHPAQMPTLMHDRRFRSYLVPCEWMRDVFEPYFPNQCRVWFGGLDANEWPDSSHSHKDIDFLVYDKLRWGRAELVTSVLDPILRELKRRALRVQTVVRGAYDHEGYRALLARSRALLFLCEHETQGLAYQEAMACNVPVLAWDPGLWLDPDRLLWTREPVRASSVPFFSPACGAKFSAASAFSETLDAFLNQLSVYAPRAYVEATLSFERSAKLYLEAYAAAK